MKRVAHIKTARVTGHEPDGSATIERHTIKIEIGKSFNNFLNHINLKGYMSKEPPFVACVLEQKETGQDWKEIDTSEYQSQVVNALKPDTNKAVDFKAISEKQAKELEESKALNASILKRLEALEGKKVKLQVDTDDILGTSESSVRLRATELGISFPNNIKDETLLSKVQILDPDFKG